MDNEALLEGVRAWFETRSGVEEVRMFGGISFIVDGNMVVAVSKRGLLARVGMEAQGPALASPGTSVMEMNGRVMAGYVYFDPAQLNPAQLGRWLNLALTFVATLPPKKRSAKRKGNIA